MPLGLQKWTFWDSYVIPKGLLKSPVPVWSSSRLPCPGFLSSDWAI